MSHKEAVNNHFIRSLSQQQSVTALSSGLIPVREEMDFNNENALSACSSIKYPACRKAGCSVRCKVQERQSNIEGKQYPAVFI